MDQDQDQQGELQEEGELQEDGELQEEGELQELTPEEDTEVSIFPSYLAQS